MACQSRAGGPFLCGYPMILGGSRCLGNRHMGWKTQPHARLPLQTAFGCCEEPGARGNDRACHTPELGHPGRRLSPLQVVGDRLQGGTDLLLGAGEQLHVPDCVGDVCTDAFTEGGRVHDIDGEPLLPFMDFTRMGV